MLVYNEGVPRSGKSYDAIRNHILPALAKGRPVFARLNGMDDESCRDAIAARLKIARADLDALLVHVNTGDVPTFFAAALGDGRKWSIDPKFRNALVIIDEVHEFWEGGTRQPMPPPNEQFFALHGHYGMDVLVMTQFYTRIHKAIRHRIERKNTFQKLSALGSKGEKLYRQSFYQTIRPDKYELVGQTTHSYDAEIYPLYHGIAPAGEGGDVEVVQEVYSGGRTSVWRSLGWRAAIIVPLGLFSIWFLLDFFSGGGTKLVKGSTRIGHAQPVSSAAPGAQASVAQPAAVVQAARPAVRAVAAPSPALKLTPEQRYVWDLSDKNRIRLMGTVGHGDDARGMVEWIDTGNNAKDRLTFAQLRDLGINVTIHEYGARLAAGEAVIIATAWPLNVPLREVQPRLYDTSGGDASAVQPLAAEPLTVASAQPAPASSPPSEPVAAYGGFRQ